tara:strand:+ start:12 stop:848 length:837 start_codon:yes stop_codon:yes gene_type:complete
MRRLCKYIYDILIGYIKNILFYIKKRNYIFAPVFIIGCGRSGTTILGNTISKHPKVKYLNERRDLWHKSYPEFDVWNKKIQDSKLYADEKDFIFKKHNLLYSFFFREQVLGNAKVLLEKLPINSFRLKFLEKSFPNARYIYLTRNGLEVSASIEKSTQKGNWFRSHDLLKSYNIEDGDQHKGMWEWKLSIDESDHFFRKINRNRFIHLSYKDFMDSPSEIIKGVFSFLELDYSVDWVNQISKDIKRKNIEIQAVSDKNLYLIGGDILNQTINNSYTPL